MVFDISRDTKIAWISSFNDSVSSRASTTSIFALRIRNSTDAAHFSSSALRSQVFDKDDLYRFEIDLIVTPAKAAAILRWRHVLKHRFEQRAIYMRLSERAFWL